ncbi:hypothetical protein Q2490_16850 [Myroides odoratimimus]|uniref:hypothetical protein n=1 Tax=Myroides odoratimimus TaxID=76832 RepID=UPI0026DF1F0F|nr:hypothetical protein [Myroides odoratimimus]MDO5858947.1 hypothetical protein [Myroides odoratimimus]
MKQYITLLLSAILLFSCQEKKEDIKPIIDYSNSTVVDSIMKGTPYSTDTIFLGLRLGMTKAEYKNHLESLKKEDNKLTFSSSNKISTMAGTFDLGAGYVYTTSISNEKDGKKLIGTGKYILEPIYGNENTLVQLNIVPRERWDNDSSSPHWLLDRIKKEYSTSLDPLLMEQLNNYEILNSYRFSGKKNNTIVYENLLTISYASEKILLDTLLLNQIKQQVVEESKEDIKI